MNSKNWEVNQVVVNRALGVDVDCSEHKSNSNMAEVSLTLHLGFFAAFYIEINSTKINIRN